MNITCLTIGSRGDVQPYIALCKGFLEEGHKATIATHAEFEPWIRSHGIDFKLVAGDPAAIMALCVENDMFTPGFLREGYKVCLRTALMYADVNTTASFGKCLQTFSSLHGLLAKEQISS